MTLSSDSVKALEYLNQTNDCVTIEKCPDGIDFDLFPHLSERGLVKSAMIVAPGQEQERYGDCGLVGYVISSAGREALKVIQQETKQRAKDEKKRKSEKRSDRAFEIFKDLIFFALGILAEHRYEIISLIKMIFGGEE